jgi:hypothetical protein
MDSQSNCLGRCKNSKLPPRYPRISRLFASYYIPTRPQRISKPYPHSLTLQPPALISPTSKPRTNRLRSTFSTFYLSVLVRTSPSILSESQHKRAVPESKCLIWRRYARCSILHVNSTRFMSDHLGCPCEIWRTWSCGSPGTTRRR